MICAQGSHYSLQSQVVSLQALPALCLTRRPAEGECCLQAEDGPLDSGRHHSGLSGTGCAPCPSRLRAHSTRSVASSWALARGTSLTDICRAAGWRPLTRSLDAIAFVWNWFPRVFSPQMDRSTEGLRFQVSLLKTTPESPYCRPCPPSPQQPNVAEHPAPGPHSVNP